MNPAQIAYDDQLQAAITEARRLLDSTARRTNVRAGKVTAPWLQDKFREFKDNLLNRRTRYCPHITQSPMVAYTAAWATDRLACADCAAALHPDEAEISRCDQCGQTVVGLYLGCAVNGPVLMAYGLCISCVFRTSAR